MRRRFAAPWATSLKVISILSSVVLLAILWLIPIPDEAGLGLEVPVRVLPVVILGACALFTVRGYEVDGRVLRVQRLFWFTRIPLGSLTGAEWRKGSFAPAWRTCGNGGLFSFSGWFHQKSIGTFRALATSVSDAVILSFSDRKPIVVTPDDPAGFVEAVRAAGCERQS